MSARIFLMYSRTIFCNSSENPGLASESLEDLRGNLTFSQKLRVYRFFFDTKTGSFLSLTLI